MNTPSVQPNQDLSDDLAEENHQSQAPGSLPSPRYIIITPAKNEEDFIEQTLDSVISQTVQPLRWVIVNDGSTDATGQILEKYQTRHDFIRVVTRVSGDHCFGSKVHAFRAGHREVEDLCFDFIGNLDADIQLPSDYYERLLERFADDASLGLSGGTRLDLVNGEFVAVQFSELNFGGAYQLFRRACYQEIGGYFPLEMGGVDTLACVMARQHGWRVRAFEDLVVRHYRPTGTAQGSSARLGYRTGRKNYLLGYHPLFEIVKLIRIRRPREAWINLCELAGFFVAALSGTKRQITDDTVRFLRQEQLGRLKRMVVPHRTQNPDPQTFSSHDQKQAITAIGSVKGRPDG